MGLPRPAASVSEFKAGRRADESAFAERDRIASNVARSEVEMCELKGA